MGSPVRVSVHIIAYNQVGLIDETVQSALAQSHPDLEVVVADDGSTDGTVARLEAYAAAHPDRFRYVTGPNVGITANSNRGLAACSGELVAFCGGDDVLLPGKIAAQVAWFAAHPDGVLCAHEVEIFRSQSGEVLGGDAKRSRRAQGGVGPEALLRHGNLFAACSVMVRRSAIPPYGFDERLPMVSDGKLWVDVLAGGGRWASLPGVWARYRRTGDNVTNRWFERCYAEAMASRAYVDAEHPEYAAANARGRVQLMFRRGIHHLSAGEIADARRYLGGAMALDPTISWKLPVWWGLAHLPASARQRALAAIGVRPPA